MRNGRLHLHRETAVIHDDGTRHCAACGDYIDPIDWCHQCQRKGEACGDPHRRLRKRVDAAFCNGYCRSWHRSPYVSGCLTAVERRELR